MSESRLAAAWAALRHAGRPALIPYLTAGHPDLRDERGGLSSRRTSIADILEVGVPFSDPLADGPMIQRSTFAALRQGMTLAGTLDLVDRLSAEQAGRASSAISIRCSSTASIASSPTPAELGIAGLLLTDLPAGGDPPLEDAGPGQPPRPGPAHRADHARRARLAEAVAGAEGFLYLVARLGVTGASRSLAAGPGGQQVARVRAVTPLPIAVGFGISHAGPGGGASPGWPTAWWWEAPWSISWSGRARSRRRRFLDQLRAALDAAAKVAA